MGQGTSRATEVQFGEAVAALVRARKKPSTIGEHAERAWCAAADARVPLSAFVRAFSVRDVRALRDCGAGGPALAAYLERTAAVLCADATPVSTRAACLSALACVLPVAFEQRGKPELFGADHGPSLASQLLAGVLKSFCASSGGAWDAPPDDEEAVVYRCTCLRALLACCAECLFEQPSRGGFLDMLAAHPQSKQLFASLLGTVCAPTPQRSVVAALGSALWRSKASEQPVLVQLAAQALLVLLAWQPAPGHSNAFVRLVEELPEAWDELVLAGLADKLQTAIAELGNRWFAGTVYCFREALLLLWLVLRHNRRLVGACLARDCFVQPIVASLLWALYNGARHSNQSGLVQLCANALLLLSTHARFADALVRPLVDAAATPAAATLLDLVLCSVWDAYAPSWPCGDEVVATVLWALANTAALASRATEPETRPLRLSPSSARVLEEMAGGFERANARSAAPQCTEVAVRLCELLCLAAAPEDAAPRARKLVEWLERAAAMKPQHMRLQQAARHCRGVVEGQRSAEAVTALAHTPEETRWLLVLVWSVAVSEVPEPFLECRDKLVLFAQPECRPPPRAVAQGAAAVPLPLRTTECVEARDIATGARGGFFFQSDDDGIPTSSASSDDSSSYSTSSSSSSSSTSSSTSSTSTSSTSTSSTASSTSSTTTTTDAEDDTETQTSGNSDDEAKQAQAEDSQEDDD